MKKTLTAAFVLAAFMVIQGVAFAGVIEGMLKSVDTTMKKLEITTNAGSSRVAYTATTIWPTGVTDPASLVGRKVKVTTDDTTMNAISVKKVAPAAAKAPAAK